ncbi:MAG: hypothetical protein WBF54_21010 [Terriglobales bacterium]
MNRVLITVFALALLCASLMAQAPQPNSGSMPQAQSIGRPAAPTASTPPRLVPGSILPVQLTKSIDAKKAKTGDEVVAKVTQDLRTNAGAIIVPKDTKIIGHITEAQARSKEQKESQLAIVFDHAVLKSGEDMQMPMTIQAIIAPRNSGSSASGSPGMDPGGSSPSLGGRPGPMGGGTPTASVPKAPADASPNASGPTQGQPPITGNTQGVVGIEHLKLAAAADAKQGSVVSSEKNNVKLDDGTLLLLRVN